MRVLVPQDPLYHLALTAKVHLFIARLTGVVHIIQTLVNLMVVVVVLADVEFVNVSCLCISSLSRHYVAV